jgi:hypothetical protein
VFKGHRGKNGRHMVKQDPLLGGTRPVFVGVLDRICFGIVAL